MTIHIGQEIKKMAKAQDIGATRLAELTDQTRSNVNNIFTRKTIDVELLLTISKILKHDFFSLYTKKLKREGAVETPKDAEAADIETLREKLELQTQNAINQQRYIHLLEEKLESYGYKFPERNFKHSGKGN